MIEQATHVYRDLRTSPLLIRTYDEENVASVGRDRGMRRALMTPLPPYVDVLPVPRRLRATEHDGRLSVHMRAGMHRFHRDLPESRVWGTTGRFPGQRLRPSAGSR
jgi:hypothetical protein